ncbi:MAG TPA: hypothetical protein VF516_18185 [Kofleriaceae bacterium]
MNSPGIAEPDVLQDVVDVGRADPPGEERPELRRDVSAGEMCAIAQRALAHAWMFA